MEAFKNNDILMKEKIAFIFSRKKNLNRKMLSISMIAPFLKKLKECNQISKDIKANFNKFYYKHKIILEDSIKIINNTK